MTTDILDKEPHSVEVMTTGDGITTITINRPHRRNAIDGPTGQKLVTAFLAFEDDPSQKVCVFYGSHGTFSAGSDLHEAAKFEEAKANMKYSGPRVGPDHHVQQRNIGTIGLSRMQIRKPIIHTISEYAVTREKELSLLGDV